MDIKYDREPGDRWKKAKNPLFHEEKTSKQILWNLTTTKGYKWFEEKTRIKNLD